MARENKAKRDERRFGKPDRLIDRVFQSRWVVPKWCESLLSDKKVGANLALHRESMLERIGVATPVVSDNVSEYFYAKNPKENWDYCEDFPSCLPPFPQMFVECLRPSRIFSDGNVRSSSSLPERWGWLLETTTRDEAIANESDPEFAARTKKWLEGQLKDLYEIIDHDEVRRAAEALKGGVRSEDLDCGDREKSFLMLGAQYMAIRSGKRISDGLNPDGAWFVNGELVIAAGDRVSLVATINYAVNSAGRLLDYPIFGVIGANLLESAEASSFRDGFNSMFMPIAMTLSFMHCKNVVMEAVEPDRALNRERKKHGFKPFLRYHTIDIEPMKKVLRTEGNIEAEGLKRALHICRGHFSTYSEERPLFGRVAGTFWIPSHTRGSIKEGMVISDYNVKVPADVPQT